MSMVFTNDWSTFSQVIDKKTCERIINLGKDKWKEAEVAETVPSLTEEERFTGRKEVYGIDPSARMSEIYWTSEDWIYNLIWPYMQEANKVAGWNLDISGAEDMQVTRYKIGGFITWHADGRSDSLSAYDSPKSPFMHGNVRKISMSLLLNDDYEGGELEFACYNKDKGMKAGTPAKLEIVPIKSKAGDIILFTSGVEHRVAPVTKGIRYSLVVWFVGPPVR